jgi:phenylalanyl-tRNA synthetase beta chain
MVVVEYTYEEMKGLIDLPRDKMIASLNALGAPSEYEPNVGKIITELTPNRPDWYSMEGLARALKAYHGGKHPAYSAKKSGYRVRVDASVAGVRPYTACAVVKGVGFNDQRIRDIVLLQEKLLATLGRKVKRFGLGLYPLKAIRFPVSYTTMKPSEIRYVPLGFDEPLSAGDILEKHKKGEQYGHLIKGFERYPVFVDADQRIMALVPIVNSAETGRVDEGTDSVFIEVTGTDMNACAAALNILVCTLADMGGAIYEVEVDYGGKKGAIMTPDLAGKAMPLDMVRVNKTLGLTLKEKDAARLLARMGYGWDKGNAIVPPYRADVMSWVDVMEDLAIAYGYDNFKQTLPGFFSIGGVASDYRHVGETMRGMGFLEMRTFILTNREKLAAIGCVDALVEISNPGSEDYTVVRPNLQVGILEAFSNNKMKGLPQKFYEIGTVYQKGRQGTRLVFGIMDKKIDFSAVRGCLQTLAAAQGIDFRLEKSGVESFEPDTSCAVLSGGKQIGVLGKARKGVLGRFGLDFDVYICELDLGADTGTDTPHFH